jgi:membrane associated rhomboid family serine protease
MIYFFYYLPVGINAELRRVPIVTYAFASLCVGVFVLERHFPTLAPFDLERLVYYPDIGSLAQAVTTTFVHGGYFHLIGNVLYLLLFGRYVEDRLGRLLFSTLFLGCAAAGNIFQGLFNTYVLNEPQLGVAGASGAVAGLLGAFTVRFFMSRLRIAYWVFMPLQAFTRGGRTELPVIFAVAFWFALEFVRGLLQAGGYGTQVAYVAHVSGFVLGAATALVAGHFEEGRVEALLRRARAYMGRGEAYAAQGEFLEYLGKRPDDPDAHAGLARALALAGDVAGATRHYRIACEALLDAKRRGDSEKVYEEALRGINGFYLSAEHHLRLAFGLERNLKPALAARAYETFVTSYPEHPESAFALLRAAGIQLNTFSNPQTASSLYDRLVKEYPDDTWADFAREQRRKLACEED